MKQNVMLRKKFIFLLAIFLFLILSFGLIIGGKRKLVAQESTLIELFVFAPCESCHEEEKFSDKVNSTLVEAGITDLECKVYNAYKESGTKRLGEISEKYGLNTTINDLPAAIVNGKCFLGSYDQIAETIKVYLLDLKDNGVNKLSPDSKNDNNEDLQEYDLTDSAVYNDITTVGKDERALLLFVTTSCESCKQAEEYLQKTLSNEQIKLHIHNIIENENAVVISKLMKIYGVPDNLQQVPILFYRNGYLSGADAIKKNAMDYLEDNETKGSWDELAENLLDENESISISKLKLAVTGFANGLNPCGISMLIMVLSVLLMSEKSFFRGSFTYMAGKFITYLLLGFAIGPLFGIIEGPIFRTVNETINIVFALLSLGFGVFYLLDFIHILKKDYGKERLRLPEKFRKWNHTKIKKLTNVHGVLWYPMLFLLGIVISAGEFLCTGQVYLATLLYMVEKNGAFNEGIVVSLLIYLMAMCLPMIILTVLVSRGKSVMSATHLSLKMLPVIKFIYSIFFFALFFSLLF